MRPLLFLLLVLLPNLLGAINLYSQSEIDSFPIIYEDVTEVNGLVILGEDIVDLSPLSQITKLKYTLYINGTTLTNLNGLNNITFSEEQSSYSSFTISNNPFLEDLSAIDNWDFKKSYEPSQVYNNPKLNLSQSNLLCRMMAKDIAIVSFGNHADCENWSNLQEHCESSIEIDPENLIFEDDFDEWIDGKPVNFDIFIFNELELNNTAKTTFLDGDSCALYFGTGTGFEGYETSALWHEFDSTYNSISLEVDVKCEGANISRICTVEGAPGTNERFSRTIWAGHGEDSTIYHIALDDIAVISEGNVIKGILFRTDPLGWLGAEASNIVIDNLKVYGKNDLTHVTAIPATWEFYPTLTSGVIHLPDALINDEIQVVDQMGQVVSVMRQEPSLDVSQLEQGIYFMMFRIGKQIHTQKFLKM